MYRGYRISLVIPCYNEEDGLQVLLEDVPSDIDEVLVVDNNSTDATAAIALSCGARVVYENNRGYGNAYKAGFTSASGDIIATMDADGMYPLESIRRLVKAITNDGCDFVTTRRIPDRRRSFSSLIRYLGDVVLNLTTKCLFGVSLKDSQSGMWVFRKDILPLLNVQSPGMAMSQELKIEAALHPDVRMAEIAVLYRDERIGTSKLSLWRDGFGNLAFLFRKRWRDGKRRARVTRGREVVLPMVDDTKTRPAIDNHDVVVHDAPENIYDHSRA
jgi:glycosyltransferase involved in cell wall biosynthesis